MDEKPRKTAKDRFNELDKVYEALQSIAKVYPLDSEEAFAIRVAAVACAAFQQHELLRELRHRWRRMSATQLRNKMKMRLGQAGIELDVFGRDNAGIQMRGLWGISVVLKADRSMTIPRRSDRGATMDEKPPKTANAQIDKLGSVRENLQPMARSYPLDSEEARAIRAAAAACAAVQQNPILRMHYHRLRWMSGTRFRDELKTRAEQAGFDLDKFGDDPFPDKHGDDPFPLDP